MTMLAPPVSKSTPFHLTTTEVVIVVIVLAVVLLLILGWRSPDRSKGADEKAVRDRIED